MPRKDDIRMNADEIRAYLAEQRTVTLVTNGPRGYPHAVAMFYALDTPNALDAMATLPAGNGAASAASSTASSTASAHSAAGGAEDLVIRFATYASSQKVRNIERDPRVTLLVESGIAYSELRGVMIEGRASLSQNTDRVVATMIEANADTGSPLPDIELIPDDVKQRMAGKRVLVSIRPERFVSWDHGKLPSGKTPEALKRSLR